MASDDVVLQPLASSVLNAARHALCLILLLLQAHLGLQARLLDAQTSKPLMVGRGFVQGADEMALRCPGGGAVGLCMSLESLCRHPPPNIHTAHSLVTRFAVGTSYVLRPQRVSGGCSRIVPDGGALSVRVLWCRAVLRS